MAGLAGYAAVCRVRENIARARTVEAVCEIADIRLTDADTTTTAADNTGGDPLTVLAQVVTEVAVTLGLSQSATRPLLTVGQELSRMPLTALRFVFGGVDWPRIQVLTAVLGKASDATIAALEFEAVAAAERLTPRSLRLWLWRLWFAHDRDEAAAAQESTVRSSRGMRVRRDCGGASVLEAIVTDLEGAEVDALVTEIAATVCQQDPRSSTALRVDGLMALIHGEHALECHCGRGERCPLDGAADRPDPRRGPLVQILLDAETLLGLRQNPAVLADGTPLDPELARLIATDAHWQGLLTELHDVLTARTPHTHQPSPTETQTQDADKTAAATNQRQVPRKMLSSLRIRVPRLIHRGRIRRAGTVPTPTSTPTNGRGMPNHTGLPNNTGLLSDTVRAQITATLLAAITADPTLAAGPHPDGHGGDTEPPPGALTYRPTTDLAARVRMTYRTCTHPGCDVPSADCELDHIVPYDHHATHRGGWTIETNLHPVCTAHHKHKTANAATVAYLAGGIILWTHTTGTRTLTFPELGCPTTARTRRHRRGRPVPEPDTTTPTWWEQHMSPATPEPTTADLRHAPTDTARTRIRLLRRKLRQHKTIQHLRERKKPPPF
ncbi:HNH endonuclease [Rhodococcus sp. RS1C4]|nr:HNH endonuclease signature motif containing protein [Rhodococcus sp. RS1C4]OZC53374.1 HNH endonuclease [Rhodococcus sp. RS1C4]